MKPLESWSAPANSTTAYRLNRGGLDDNSTAALPVAGRHEDRSNTMTKQVTMTMYAHVASEWYDTPFTLFQCDMSEHGHIYLGPVEVTFTPPTTDPVSAEMTSIDKAMQSVRAELKGKLNALQERRDNLLAIGCDSE